MLYNHVAFKYEFRDYQQRVLNTLKEKSEDNKIHIVAAPGSGKTVLGLEIIRRFDCPCLVLTPSISIREQWIDRFMELFVAPEAKEYWRIRVSNDIEKPGIITCITYQALYTLYSKDNFNECVLRLKKSGYRVVCLDESHHLKNEWWKALESTVKILDNPLIISLTATPPYDSDNQEWARYNNLCGAIDCEVLTPEMVKKNTLCPYQDHVYLSVPTTDEINSFREQEYFMNKSIRELLVGNTLYRLIRNYDALCNPHDRAEIFIEEPRFLNALISYVRFYGIESAVYYEKEKGAIDAVISNWDSSIVELAYGERVPLLEGELLELFLEVVIKKDAEHFDAELLEEFVNELSKKHLFKNNKIYIRNHREEIEKLARESVSKIESIKEIVLLEMRSMGDNLQMVILLDHIGREDVSKIGSTERINKMNCAAVFESIRRMEHLNNLDSYMKSYMAYIREFAGTNLGLLCGSFAILPKKVQQHVGKEGKVLGETGYILFEIGESERSEIVKRVTMILERRLIKILIGTVSLLGEGWDAPSINTVVIGSTISSFVQTNQIRGRGMRIERGNPLKVTNIWHLMTLNPDFKNDRYVGGQDYRNMVRRFETIMGISRNGDVVSSGIERIGLVGSDVTGDYFSAEFLNRYTRDVLAYATNRDFIRNQWDRIIQYPGDFSKTREIATLKSAGLIRWKNTDNRFTFGEIKKIAKGLHANMCRNGLIGYDSKLIIKANYLERKIGVFVENCKPKDSKLFIKYYEQITGDIIAPRYIIGRGYGPFVKYIAVPDYLKNKADVIRLISDIGFRNSQLIYTKNEDGLRLLFNLRLQNLKVDKNTIEKVRMIVIK